MRHSLHRRLRGGPRAVVRAGAFGKTSMARVTGTAAGFVAKALGLALLICVASRPAAAQWGISVGGSLGSTINGGTDLNLPTAVTPIPGEGSTTPADTDVFLRAAFGADYYTRTRRAAHQLTYNFASYVHYQDGDKLVTLNNDLLWLAAITPSRETELTLNASASQGRTGDLYLFNRAAAGTSVARPNSSISFIAAHLGENFAANLGPFWAFTQDADADGFLPIFDDGAQASTGGGAFHLGLGRRFINDGFGLRAGVGYGRSSSAKFDETVIYPARQATYGDAGFYFNHAFSDDWGMRLGGGVVGVRVPSVRDPFVDWQADASVNHRTTTGGHVELALSRGIATNVFIGDVLLQNSADLRWTQFFGRNEAWQFVGGLDVQQAKSVFVVDTKEGGLKIFSALASLNYEFSRHLLCDFEANYTYQDAEASRRYTMYLPPYTLHRLMLMASLTWVFPQPEKLTGGAGGRRRPRVLGGKGPSDFRTGIEAAIDPGTGERPTSSSSSRRRRDDVRTDRRDSARGVGDTAAEPEEKDPLPSLPQ